MLLNESISYEKMATEFLELASEQRIRIIFLLLNKKSRVSSMAKKLNVTAQEVSRNFDRMANSGLIKKERDGFFHISTYGKAVCSQIPSLAFLLNNKKFFEDHNFGSIPSKFIQRIGALENTQHIDGVVKVFDKWKQIYKNANEYVFDLLSEMPLDLMEVLVKRVKKGIKYQHIISESAKIPIGRKKFLEKIGFNELLEKDLIRRRMIKRVSVSVILNEKECAVIFPSKKGDPDLREMFYGTDRIFHEWCIDYFKYCWNRSDTFREFKLKE